ncbi:MAG: aspartate kinase [Defluviitaleaceae bacterium]|nr:aspartate kinase [Defluviitaleaceae bacterium]
MLIVQKYGGSSLATAEKILYVANKIKENYLKGNDMVVVLSAQGDMTDILLEKAKEISKNPSKRELDVLLSTGEVQSAALMAMALEDRGFSAVSLNALQAGIFSTSEHGLAKIVSINPTRIKNELKAKKIVIITGFQGIDEHGNITTLGRGASDTTAIALASALVADLCEIYTDVEGIYTADPKQVENAIKHKELCYNETLELAQMGASVLHSRSVELAQKFGIDFFVKSSTIESEPTLIKACNLEEKIISGIASEKKICKLSITNISGEKMLLILQLLAMHKISVDMASCVANNLSFVVHKSDLSKTLEIINAYFSEEILVEKNLVKISLVGTGVAYDTEILALFYETLLKEGVEISLLSLSTIKISVLVKKDDTKRAIKALHKNLVEGV